VSGSDRVLAFCSSTAARCPAKPAYQETGESRRSRENGGFFVLAKGLKLPARGLSTDTRVQTRLRRTEAIPTKWATKPIALGLEVCYVNVREALCRNNSPLVTGELHDITGRDKIGTGDCDLNPEERRPSCGSQKLCRFSHHQKQHNVRRYPRDKLQSDHRAENHAELPERGERLTGEQIIALAIALEPETFLSFLQSARPVPHRDFLRSYGFRGEKWCNHTWEPYDPLKKHYNWLQAQNEALMRASWFWYHHR
jgi:hypothetical protein